MATKDDAASQAEPRLLGPFLGHVTPSSIRIWLHAERDDPQIHVTLHEGEQEAAISASGIIILDPARLHCGWVTIDGLKPDTLYYYKLWTNAAHSVGLHLGELLDRDLHFRTLSSAEDEQVDFLVMSCHNPTVSAADGHDGHAVWADLPQVIARDSNRKVRFALLVGDQVYADDWKERILAETSEEGRLKQYLSAYRRFWSNIHYRRILCSLPSVMIWDDHDIIDGWGSDMESFDDDRGTFKPAWKGLFDAAYKAFGAMQASRNPDPLDAAPGAAYDFCFRVGKWGFAFLDLRTNRNWMKRQLMTPHQANLIQQWVQAQQGMHTLFVVSPVVFSHGSPVLDDLTVKLWPLVMKLVGWIANFGKWGSKLQTGFNKSLHDIRDDIRDGWGDRSNAAQADMMLDFLFGLQNRQENPVGVVILCGDIHTSGYATIYSSDPAHRQRSSIPHITSSSVSYSPFNWLLEAIYRHGSKTVALGARGAYSAQISHHFCSRSAALLSLRPMREEGDYQLKVKYYVEGFPEPHILMFDLNKASHREDIAWVAQEKLFNKDYAPTARVNVEAALIEAARTSTLTLNWRESTVDLMKLLGLDSSLEARRRLAVEWGYTGSLENTFDMNVWLHQQLIRRFEENGGKLPPRPEPVAAAAPAPAPPEG